MTLTRRSFLGALLVCALTACGGAQRLPPERAILILISVDGFRADYLDRFRPPALSKLALEGVHADGLIPQFPSKTFPNHYTLVTGLTLAHHGIISNNIRDAAIPGEFSLSNREVQSDPRWWGGEPIWNTAERQGRKTAAMFWPGSEVMIGGRRGTYWMPFDNDMPHADRVNHILDWLRLPESERPSFLTLYFADVDSAGHRSGPDSAEVKDAVMLVDKSIGDLVAGVQQIGLSDRVNYVVVSDHGMAALSPDRTIVLDDYIDVATAEVVDWSPVLALTPKDGSVRCMTSRTSIRRWPFGAARYLRSTALPDIRACRRSSRSRKKAGSSRRRRKKFAGARPIVTPLAARMAMIRACRRCTGCSSPTDRGSAAA